MKIDEIYRDVGLVNSHSDLRVNKKSEDQKEPVDKQERQDKTGAEVKLSRTSVEFSKAVASMDNQVTERAAKIESLKTQVQDGTYDIDAGKIADKMIKDSLENMI